MIDQYAEAQLVSGGDTLLHYHLADRATNPLLQEQAGRRTFTGLTHTVQINDDFLLADTSSNSITFTLPPARNGREYEFIKLASANTVFIAPDSGGDTVLGSLTGVALYNQYDALRLKAITGGWVAI